MVNSMKISFRPQQVGQKCSLLRIRVLMQLPILLLGILAISACSAETPTPNPLIDQSTPQATINSLYLATYLQDSDMFRSLLDPDDPDINKLVRAFKKMKAEGIRVDVTDVQIDVVEEQVDMVRLRARFQQVILVDGIATSAERNGDEHTLVKKNGRWYLFGYGQSPPPGWIGDDTDWMHTIQTATAP